METRKHESYDKEEWYDCPTLVREDSVSLILVGQGRERQLRFIYADKHRNFQFTASRYEDSLTDEWRVLLDAGLNRLPPEKTPTFEDVREIADNIRDCLLAWGWYENTERTTAKTVGFKIRTWRHWSPALGWGEQP
jgi:hypothetical protein